MSLLDHKDWFDSILEDTGYTKESPEFDDIDDSVFENGDNEYNKNHKRKTGKYFEYVPYNDKRAKSLIFNRINVEMNQQMLGEIAIESKTGTYAGYVTVTKSGILDEMFVEEEFRGYGIGDQFVTDAIHKYGANTVDVLEDNYIAIDLYKKYGFKEYKKYTQGINKLITMKLEDAGYTKESEDKSIIDKDHKQNGHKKLSDFKMSKTQHRNEGNSFTLTWTDDNKNVAKVTIDSIPASDGYRWFGDLEISEKYRGYGLSDQILDLAINKYKAGALAVHKDNQIAYNLYKKHGFKIGPYNGRDESFYYMYLKRNKENIESNINEGGHMIEKNKPKKCSQCGSEEIGTFIEGEPIYKCKKCGKYLGTVPFPNNTKESPEFDSIESDEIVEEGFKHNRNKFNRSIKKTRKSINGISNENDVIKAGYDPIPKSLINKLYSDAKWIHSEFVKEYNKIKNDVIINDENKGDIKFSDLIKIENVDISTFYVSYLENRLSGVVNSNIAVAVMDENSYTSLGQEMYNKCIKKIVSAFDNIKKKIEDIYYNKNNGNDTFDLEVYGTYNDDDYTDEKYDELDVIRFSLHFEMTLRRHVNESVYDELDDFDTFVEGANLDIMKELHEAKKEDKKSLKKISKAINEGKYKDARKYFNEYKKSAEKSISYIRSIDMNSTEKNISNIMYGIVLFLNTSLNIGCTALLSMIKPLHGKGTIFGSAYTITKFIDNVLKTNKEYKKLKENNINVGAYQAYISNKLKELEQNISYIDQVIDEYDGTEGIYDKYKEESVNDMINENINKESVTDNFNDFELDYIFGNITESEYNRIKEENAIGQMLPQVPLNGETLSKTPDVESDVENLDNFINDADGVLKGEINNYVKEYVTDSDSSYDIYVESEISSLARTLSYKFKIPKKHAAILVKKAIFKNKCKMLANKNTDKNDMKLVDAKKRLIDEEQEYRKMMKSMDEETKKQIESVSKKIEDEVEDSINDIDVSLDDNSTTNKKDNKVRKNLSIKDDDKYIKDIDEQLKSLEKEKPVKEENEDNKDFTRRLKKYEDKRYNLEMKKAKLQANFMKEYVDENPVNLYISEPEYSLIIEKQELESSLKKAQELNNLESIRKYENKLKANELRIMKESVDINEVVLLEAAPIEDEIKDIIDVLREKGYHTKYSSPGHHHLRRKEDADHNGVYNGKLYSDARLMFDDDYKSIPDAPKYWYTRLVDDKTYLDVKPITYNSNDGTPDEAFAKWKDKYMTSLREWANEIGKKPGPKEKSEKDDEVTKESPEFGDIDDNYQDFCESVFEDLNIDLALDI